MGARAGAEIDAWLRQGGLVVTASERAARSLASAFHRARQAEGLSAWNAPNIQDWSSFVRSAWSALTFDGRLLLNSTQEQVIWAGIAAADGRLATLLEGPRYRLADLAMEAHALLCSHTPRFLRASARAGWQNDAAAFSRWLNTFDETCRTGNLLSPARLPNELLQLLQGSTVSDGQAERPPLLLAGFDRILPVQRAVFDAWGNWQEAGRGEAAGVIDFYEARDDQAELAACALWCRRRLAGNPRSRILVVTQDAAKRRGQIERAFLGHTGSATSPLFEFSLGVPLSQMALPHAAHLMLRWLTGPLAEHELDWLLFTGHAAATTQETAALQAHMRRLRSRGLEQPSWTLQAFIQTLAGRSPEPALDRSPVREWLDRMTQVQRRLAEATRRPQAPLDWAELIPQLLEDAAWPGARPLSSAEFQAARRWQQTLETTGSLGFDGRRVDWKDFLSALARTLEETLFAPESRDAPIQIAGPAESAGLTADAVWFLGATEDAWPASGATHPLLPPEVQREARMPHATPQLDWDLAQAITARLLAAAPEVHFRYARQIEGVESRPSRLVAALAGASQPLPVELAPAPSADPLTICVEDSSRIPYPPGRVHGGASVLTFQSQCPFKAFAAARLAAQSWEPAQTGLTPSQRGQLLHAVLHAVWAGPANGIRRHADLMNLTDRRAFVANHVQRVFAAELRPGLRQRMPARYLELEQLRLTGLVTEWLDYETARVPFDVLKTEAERSVSLAGLIFDLRLDRIDRLNDGSLLVIDYKSGDVSPKSWELPRPDDVQLPLYAGFALDEGQELGGLVFAKVRPGDLAFAGCVGDPSATLISGLKNHTALARNALTAEQLMNWRDCIEQLAKDFLNGRAEVDPREYPETCERCGLQTLCRIQEKQAVVEDAEDGEEPEADDE
ncbi:MAG TPA: PD-(D/E)XK nuclease family protein [Gemmataceae bacterium]|nr:PD-(D/E)XK nuclease family protein [Gemmataceae bacterium]